MAKSQLSKTTGQPTAGGDIFSTLHNEIDRIFDQFGSGGRWPISPWSTGDGKHALQLDVSETDDEIEVTADLPGVEQDDVSVNLSGEMLTIKGEKKTEKETTEKDMRMIERSYGSYERTIRLPCEVDDKKVSAEMKNGVLKVKLPKSPETKAKTKKIKVKAH